MVATGLGYLIAHTFDSAAQALDALSGFIAGANFVIVKGIVFPNCRWG
jgi:hypothetical protein